MHNDERHDGDILLSAAFGYAKRQLHTQVVFRRLCDDSDAPRFSYIQNSLQLLLVVKLNSFAVGGRRQGATAGGKWRHRFVVVRRQLGQRTAEHAERIGGLVLQRVLDNFKCFLLQLPSPPLHRHAARRSI